MFNFFLKFASCYRLSRRRGPPSDDGFLCRVDTSGDFRRVRSNRIYCRRNRPSDWRPALSVIMEDCLDLDHDINVKSKSDDSSRKNKSVADVASISRFHEKEISKPKMYVTPFSATPYMF